MKSLSYGRKYTFNYLFMMPKNNHQKDNFMIFRYPVLLEAVLGNAGMIPHPDYA